MKAVWYERTGAAPDVLSFGDMPTPVAGPGEVRIRLQASGVNPADVGRRAGSYRAMEFPRVIPNSDGAGVVDQLSDGVTRLRLGQRVWFYNGQRNGRAFGTAAEYIALAEHLVTPQRKPIFRNGSPRESVSTTSPHSLRCRRRCRLTSRWKKATSSAPSLSTARDEAKHAPPSLSYK